MTERLNSALILLETFDSRLSAAEVLTATGNGREGNVAGLRRAAGRLDDAAARSSETKIAAILTAFADLIRVAAFLVDWRRAVLDAEPDSDRLKRSALERINLWRSDNGKRQDIDRMEQAVDGIGETTTLADVGLLCLKLARVPLPIAIRAKQPVPSFGPFAQRQTNDKETPADLHVAFLSFTVDGLPADQIQFLTPHETHDLEIEVRASRWPDDAVELNLSPVSIEAAGAYDFPKFMFERPTGNPPFVMRQRGRAVINAAQALRAQPFEFRYAAEFSPRSAEQPVSVVGHRTLRIESIDVRRSPLTGYPAMDQRLLDLRNKLRAISPMPQDDLEAAMNIVAPLASLASRSLQDALFPKAISEAEFQRAVRDDLRRLPNIAARLEEHAQAAGGETDLSYLGIRLELKVVKDRSLVLEDCQSFVEQAAMYAVGSGKRLAVLCVLDVSSKRQAPFPAEEGVGILLAKSDVAAIAILIQGGLIKPSDLSRRRAKAAHKARGASPLTS